MNKQCKGAKSKRKNFNIAEIIETAIKKKQRVWYSEVYNTWLTQKNSTRSNYILMFDFTKE